MARPSLVPLGGQLTPAEIKTIKNWIDGLAVTATTPPDAKVEPPEIKPPRRSKPQQPALLSAR
jgi:hypothetical protein